MKLSVDVRVTTDTRREPAQEHFARVGAAVLAGVILTLYLLATLGALTVRLLWP